MKLFIVFALLFSFSATAESYFLGVSSGSEGCFKDYCFGQSSSKEIIELNLDPNGRVEYSLERELLRDLQVDRNVTLLKNGNTCELILAISWKHMDDTDWKRTQTSIGCNEFENVKRHRIVAHFSNSQGSYRLEFDIYYEEAITDRDRPFFSQFAVCQGWPHEGGFGTLAFFKNLNDPFDQTIMVQSDQQTGVYGSINMVAARLMNPRDTDSMKIRSRPHAGWSKGFTIVLKPGQNVSSPYRRDGESVVVLLSCTMESM